MPIARVITDRRLEFSAISCVSKPVLQLFLDERVVLGNLDAGAVSDQIGSAVANITDDRTSSVDASAYQGGAHIAESRIAGGEIADGAIGLLDGVQQSALDRQLRRLRGHLCASKDSIKLRTAVLLATSPASAPPTPSQTT